jgi:hypothetical protein
MFSILVAGGLLMPLVNAQFQVPHHKRSTTVVPSAPFKGPVTADFISKPNSLDGPHLSKVNETTSEWWYFDVVSEGLAHVVVTFYTATNVSFPLIGPSKGVDSVQLSATFENGTMWESSLVSATQAVITTEGDGASGHWEGTGVSFEGRHDLSVYVIKFEDQAATGIKGTIVWNAVGVTGTPSRPPI